MFNFSAANHEYILPVNEFKTSVANSVDPDQTAPLGAV